MKKHCNIGNFDITSKVNNLSPEEIRYICKKIELIKNKDTLKNLSKNTGFLAGFRIDKITSDILEDQLIKNINSPAIRLLLGGAIDCLLQEIQENITKLEEDGIPSGEALLKVIRDSVFNDNCKLYFKLSDLSNDARYIELFSDAISYIKKNETPRKTELEKKTNQSKLMEDIKELNSQIKIYADNNEKIKEELSRAQLELAHYKDLEKHADVEFNIIEHQQFQYISIGKIVPGNQYWPIKRLADIEGNIIKPFIYDPSKLSCFENRDRLYRKDGPANEGAVAVWNWNPVPKEGDPSKDVCISEYNPNAIITQVVELHQCTTIDDIAKLLLQGLENNLVSKKVLWVCTTMEGKKEGLLCLPSNLDQFGNEVKLSKSVVILPHYTLKDADIISIDGIRVFCKINLGIPNSLYHVKTPCDVVKEKLISRISYRKDGEFAKKDIKNIKSYLTNIPTETIVQEVAKSYECSEDKAEEYVNEFTAKVDAYLDSSDLDMNIISIALEKNANLVESCKEQISKEWEEENRQKISEETDVLNAIKQNHKKLEKEVEELKDKKDKLSSQIKNIEEQITKKETLAADVEKQIAKRIEDARQNAADFISQMAFVPSVSVASSETRQLPVFMSTIDSEFKYTDIEDLDDFEDELRANFVISGYEDRKATDMAYAISFSICNRIPVIIRENSTEISRCVASLINAGGLYEVFVPIEGISIDQLLKSIFVSENDKPRVFLIHGVFDGYNLNIFNALVNNLKNHKDNIFVFLSIEGLSAKMLPPDVWNRAFYIDGDDGLMNLTKGKIHSFNVSLEYTYPIDNGDFRKKKEQLNAFSKIIGCMQMNLYAMYLSCFNVNIDRSDTILNQIIANACSSDSEELLQSLFRENGISRGEELLSKIL